VITGTFASSAQCACCAQFIYALRGRRFLLPAFAARASPRGAPRAEGPETLRWAGVHGVLVLQMSMRDSGRWRVVVLGGGKTSDVGPTVGHTDDPGGERIGAVCNIGVETLTEFYSEILFRDSLEDFGSEVASLQGSLSVSPQPGQERIERVLPGCFFDIEGVLVEAHGPSDSAVLTALLKCLGCVALCTSSWLQPPRRQKAQLEGLDVQNWLGVELASQIEIGRVELAKK